MIRLQFIILLRSGSDFRFLPDTWLFDSFQSPLHWFNGWLWVDIGRFQLQSHFRLGLLDLYVLLSQRQILCSWSKHDNEEDGYTGCCQPWPQATKFRFVCLGRLTFCHDLIKENFIHCEFAKHLTNHLPLLGSTFARDLNGQLALFLR